jgi:hypothetical protein
MLPANFEACGGLYVHYQFCKIEEELGYHSFIAFPDSSANPHVSWFRHACMEINYSDVHKIILSNNIPVEEPILLIGWEDIDCMSDFFQYTSINKIAFIQNQAYFKGAEYYKVKGATLWFPSQWLRNYLQQEGECIPQYIDSKIFYAASDYSRFSYGSLGSLRVLVQERKSGWDRVHELKKALPLKLLSRLDFTILPGVSHIEFANALRNSDLFFAHSFPEGLPLTPMEAMSCGSVVFGYTGGGGSYYMNSDNCILAEDGNFIELAKKLEEQLFCYDIYSKMNALRSAGYCTVYKFNRKNTITLLKSALDKINI